MLHPIKLKSSNDIVNSHSFSYSYQLQMNSSVCYKNQCAWYNSTELKRTLIYFYRKGFQQRTHFQFSIIVISRMKNIRHIVTLILIALWSEAFSQTTTFDELNSKAKAENKNILLYFSGSDWCAPCILFKKQFLETDTFRSFAAQQLLVFNADFPRKKVNKLSDEKTAENEKIAERYNPNGLFPLIILLNNEGKIIRKWESLPAISLEEFINQLQ